MIKTRFDRAVHAVMPPKTQRPMSSSFLFFQAEDGIRDLTVTGVQTCALPISTRRALSRIAKEGRKYGVFLGLVTQRPAEIDSTIISQCSTLFVMRLSNDRDHLLKIGRASCRERV